MDRQARTVVLIGSGAGEAMGEVNADNQGVREDDGVGLDEAVD